MTEDDARAWCRDQFDVPRETMFARFVDMVVAESAHQNLLAASTIDVIWARHVLDSAQLIKFAGADGLWMDIGTGAGFPGIIAAIACPERSFVLVEPRRRRADFLQQCVDQLGFGGRVQVAQSSVATLNLPSTVITARAVAALPQIFNLAEKCATRATRWVLPKGRSASEEVEEARKTWHGSFQMEPSLTDPDARIVIATNVRRR